MSLLSIQFSLRHLRHRTREGTSCPARDALCYKVDLNGCATNERYNESRLPKLDFHHTLYEQPNTPRPVAPGRRRQFAASLFVFA